MPRERREPRARWRARCLRREPPARLVVSKAGQALPPPGPASCLDCAAGPSQLFGLCRRAQPSLSGPWTSFRAGPHV